MNSRICLALTLALLFLSGCGKKEESPTVDATVEVICSYAPSRSREVLTVSSSAGGIAAGAAAVAHAAGLTAVAHSSGAYIFTGTTGYLAGTLGSAALLPVSVAVGGGVGGTAAVVELMCAPKNHPELVLKVQAFANEAASWLK